MRHLLKLFFLTVFCLVAASAAVWGINSYSVKYQAYKRQHDAKIADAIASSKESGSMRDIMDKIVKDNQNIRENSFNIIGEPPYYDNRSKTQSSSSIVTDVMMGKRFGSEPDDEPAPTVIIHEYSPLPRDDEPEFQLRDPMKA